LYPGSVNVTEIPLELNPGCDVDTTTVCGREPIELPDEVTVMDDTEHSLLPPRDATTTFMYPVVVVLSAEIAGPGAFGVGEDSCVGGDGGVGPDAVETRSYCLTNFQDMYRLNILEEEDLDSSSRRGRDWQSSTAKTLLHLVGLFAAINSNAPFDSTKRTFHI